MFCLKSFQPSRSGLHLEHPPTSFVLVVERPLLLSSPLPTYRFFFFCCLLSNHTSRKRVCPPHPLEASESLSQGSTHFSPLLMHPPNPILSFVSFESFSQPSSKGTHHSSLLWDILPPCRRAPTVGLPPKIAIPSCFSKFLSALSCASAPRHPSYSYLFGDVGECPDSLSNQTPRPYSLSQFISLVRECIHFIPFTCSCLHLHVRSSSLLCYHKQLLPLSLLYVFSCCMFCWILLTPL